jgi:hypothetical protein
VISSNLAGSGTMILAGLGGHLLDLPTTLNRAVNARTRKYIQTVCLTKMSNFVLKCSSMVVVFQASQESYLRKNPFFQWVIEGMRQFSRRYESC